MPLRARRVDQLLEICDEIRELRDFDIPLNYIAGVQVPNRLNKLLKSIIILLFLIKIIRMLFGDFGYNFPGEICRSGYVLCLGEKALFEQGLDLHIILHFVELKQLLLQSGFPGDCCQHIDGVLFNLNE